jgi:hypothetical protein
MRNVYTAMLGLAMMTCPLAMSAQATDDLAAKNATHARAILEAMVQALGGEAWLSIKNVERDGQGAAFFHGDPDLGTTQFFEFLQGPDHDRIEYTKHRDVVQIYVGNTGMEVTYKGKAPLPKDQVDDHLRRSQHSIETVIKTWLPDPQTILIYDGQRLAERHLTDQVTLISSKNDAVTIQTDTQTHLPLRRSFEWRDPLYKDKNVDAEEYDDYHLIDGLPTALRVTRFKNDEQLRQFYLVHVKYNQDLPSDIWDVAATEKRIKK